MLFGSFLIQQGHPGFPGETGVPGHQGMPVRGMLHASHSASSPRQTNGMFFTHSGASWSARIDWNPGTQRFSCK